MKTIKTLIILIFLAITSLSLALLNWPLSKVLLTATFGESRGDHFHNGIDLGGGKQEVHPVKDGRLIYYFDMNEHIFDKGFGNGNLVIMEHKNNERSFYYHLSSIEETCKRKKSLTTADILGISGTSGRSIGVHLHLTYKKGDDIINPLKHLSRIEDNKKPKIASIYLKIDGRLITIPKRFTVTGAESFEILAKVYDTYKKIERIAVLGIYRIAFYIDDRVISDYTFEKFIQKDGHLTFNKKSNFKDFYHDMNIYKGGKYRNLVGQHTITVRAWDFSGNTSSRMVTVNFR
ncbi:MAG: M23 family metallopeptidase [Spirochaetes bacterium]|nr:M23 family metallopeptidase [Spirochaetota bacterium]